MAGEKHIKKLEIGNFKRFSNFKVDNLGQFNLIVGDNNTGKTSLLEALLFDEDLDVWGILSRLFSSFTFRGMIQNPEENTELGVLSFVKEKLYLFSGTVSNELKVFLDGKYSLILRPLNDVQDYDYLSEFEKQKLALENKPKPHFIYFVNELKKSTLRGLKLDSGYLPFIPFGKGYDSDLIQYFSNKIDINKNKRDKFLQNLKSLIPKVDDVRIGNNAINIYEEDRETPMPLYTYGEGANKLFRILCELAINEGKRLMIDEIDTGIHHTRFKEFWRTIIKMAKAYDVQLFATTHNEECLDYFREVLEEEEMEDYRVLGRVVSLKEREDGSVKARVYDYDYLVYADEANRELRGGRL